MDKIRLDPEKNEASVLLEFADNFAGKRVLEVGCGDGRVTMLYAPQATFVVAIDPKPEAIDSAVENLPPDLHDRIQFCATSVEDYKSKGQFEAVLLSWSL